MTRAALGVVTHCHLYRYHPDTGADAELLDTSGHVTEELAARLEFEQRIRCGALFYWLREIDGSIRRVELRAYLTLTDATGGTLILDHTPR
jgi:hypothetical protein